MVALDMDWSEKCSVTGALMKAGGSSERASAFVRHWRARPGGTVYLLSLKRKVALNVRVPNSMNVRDTYTAPETGPSIRLMTPTAVQGEFGFWDGVDGLSRHPTPRSHNENCRATIGQN